MDLRVSEDIHTITRLREGVVGGAGVLQGVRGAIQTVPALWGQDRSTPGCVLGAKDSAGP